jgi:hypothetical protein
VSAWSEEHAEELAGEALEAVGITDARVSLIRFRDAFATLRVERPPLLIKLGAPEAKDALDRERFGVGMRLLEEWMREPEKRCFELDWPAESVPG